MSELISHAELVERVRDAVRRSGLSQNELARRTERSQAVVNRAIVSGGFKDATTLCAILELLTGEHWEGERMYRLT